MQRNTEEKEQVYYLNGSAINKLININI